MKGLRRVGAIARALLLPVVLAGSAAYLVGAGWRDVIGLVPACQTEARGDVRPGELRLVTCIRGQQPPGLAWFGTAFAVVVWLALLRWSRTSAALRVAARSVITAGTGMFAASLFAGSRDDRALTCVGPDGWCPVMQPLSLTHAALGLAVGAALAFALIPLQVEVAPPKDPNLARVGVDGGSVEDG